VDWWWILNYRLWIAGGLLVDSGGCWWITGGCLLDWQWIGDGFSIMVNCWWISGGSGGHVVDCGGLLVDIWWMSGGCPVDCWWIAGRFSIMVDVPLSGYAVAMIVPKK